MIPFLIAGVLLGLLWWYSTAPFSYWKTRGVASLKPVPFFGDTWKAFLGKLSFSDQTKELYNASKGHKVMGLYQFRSPMLMINDPEVIKQVLVKDFQFFPDRGIPYDEKTQPLSVHLFLLEGQTWRRLRIKLTPTFTSGKMKMMLNVIKDCSEQFVQYLNKSISANPIIECKDACGKYTTDVIGTCAFGLQLSAISDQESEFRQMGKKLFKPDKLDVLKQILMALEPRLKKLISSTSKVNQVHAFFLKEVNSIVAHREKHHIERNDFLQLLIHLKNKGKVEIEAEDKTELANDMKTVHDHTKYKSGQDDNFELTDVLLAAQCFVFFIAGFETASSVMSFCLYELALNPDIQDRLHQEIRQVLDQYGGDLTYEAVQNMDYLDMVIAETLRKYPTVPHLTRKCAKQYPIPGTDVVVEEGVRILVPVAGLHHDPLYFPDPDRFDPERFTEENKTQRNKFVYLPFGDGPRICIGMRFGQMQAKVGLIALLTNFKFHVCDKTSIPLVIQPRSFVPAVKDGIHLRFSTRTS